MTILKTLGIATIASLTLAAPTLSSAQISKQGAGYLFRIKYTPKQKLTYKIAIKPSMGAGQQAMTLTMLTKSVSGNQAVVENTMTGGPGGKPQVNTVTVDNRGRIIKSSQPGTEQISNLQLPEKPVPIGGTWTGEVNMSGMKAKSTYKFVGIKSVGGAPCAQIGVTMAGGMAQMSMKGTGSMLVRLVDGTMQTTTMAMNMTITPPSGNAGTKPKPMNIKVDMTMNRA